MRIAIVSREYPPFFGGGIGTYARVIAPALADEGCSVHVITQTHDRTHGAFALRDRITEHRVPFDTRAGWERATARFSVDAARIVARLARRNAIDVVEFAECEGAGAAITVLRAGGLRSDPEAPAGVPVVVHMHSPTELLFVLRSFEEQRMSRAWASRFLLERASILLADRLCAPSAYHARWCRSAFLLPTQPEVIPLAFSAPPPSPPLSGDLRTVMYLGRIEPRKGVEPLVRAWEHVSRERPDWTLRLVGADTRPGGASMRARLLREMSDTARRSVQFVDAVPPSALSKQFATAAICVVPSLWENFPFTCVEAMAHARPVIVSDEGGMSEMIGRTEAGVVHRAGDTEDLTRAMIGMIDESAQRRAERGQVGRKRIVRMCDPVAVARARIRLYESAARGAYRSRTEGTQARLQFWGRMRDVAAGSDEIGLPVLAERISRWLPEGEAA